MRKGSQVYFEGKLQTRKWQDQSGQDKYTTEVVVDINGQMQMLGGRSGGGGDTSFGNNSRPQQQNQQPQPAPAMDDDFDDDIPF